MKPDGVRRGGRGVSQLDAVQAMAGWLRRTDRAEDAREDDDGFLLHVLTYHAGQELGPAHGGP